MTKPSQLAALFALVASCSALADVVWKNAGATIGPVTSINCAPDAGLFCTRDAGMVGTIKCNAASTTEPGCVTPSSQTFGGAKTFTAGITTSFVDAGIVNVGGCQLLAGEVLCPVIDAGFIGAGLVQSVLFDGGFGYFGAVDFRVYGPGQSAASTVGLGLTMATGAGGLGQNLTVHPGGAGGPLSISAGNGGSATSTQAGSNGGAGGNTIVSAGSGGDGFSTQSGGFGGNLYLFSGDGGQARGAGFISVVGGSGGVSTASTAAGSGGAVSVTAGNGGDKPSGALASGAGGVITIAGGNGGAAAVGSGGTGGSISITGGNAGTGSNVAGGAVNIDTGVAQGTEVGGANTAVNVGLSNAGLVDIGGLSTKIRIGYDGGVIGSSTFALGHNGMQYMELRGVVQVNPDALSDSSQASLSVGGGFGLIFVTQASNAIDFPNILAQTCSDQTISVANVAANDAVTCALPTSLESNLGATCFISTAGFSGVATVRLCNPTSGAINPASHTYGVRVFR